MKSSHVRRYRGDAAISPIDVRRVGGGTIRASWYSGTIKPRSEWARGYGTLRGQTRRKDKTKKKQQEKKRTAASGEAATKEENTHNRYSLEMLKKHN